jgi:transposase
MSDDARPSTSDLIISPPSAALPDDPAVLRQMIAELLELLRDTQREKEELQHRLDLLLRRLYGPRTERFDPNQGLLIPDVFGAAPQEPTDADAAPPVAEPDAPSAKVKKGRPHGRRALPKNLRRVVKVHELTESERSCPECGTLRTQIGAERSEQLDYEPATLFIVEHVRCTYACPHCEGQVITTAKPAQPIERGLPGPGLMAHVITEKYADHIPLYRQERRLARAGVELSRSTLCDWTAGAAKMLEPLYELMKSLILLCGTIHTDDTSVNVRDSERKIKATGALWIYFGDYLHPYNVFDFTMSRKRDGPSHFLRGYRGFLQADGFSGYDGIYAGGDVIEVGCNAHARRKFVEAQKTDAARASAGLGYYRELYAIEKEIKGALATLAADADEPTRAALRLRVRQEKSVPILKSFENWLKSEKAEVLPKSPMNAAIGYVQNQWEALVRYAGSGYLSIDNNVAEQQMKKVATGRKNWLFVGSENGGKTLAILLTVVSSCQRHGHDPFVYLRDVLTRLPDHPRKDLADLLPDRWSLRPAVETTARSESPGTDRSPT